MRDVLVIGGGVAGLTAATYLGRFRRRALVVDGDSSRARWIPESHNIPGFPQGIGGEQLLARLRSQAARYGAEIVPGWVGSLVREDSGFALEVDGQTLRSRYVVMATGTEDHLPPLPGAAEALLRSVLRVCPICDAFEAIGQRIAVIGDGQRGEEEAGFLRTYSEQVCYLHVGPDVDRKRRQRLKDQGIDLIETELAQLRVKGNALELTMPEGMSRVFDVFYGALGCSARIELATALGAQCDESRVLQVDAHQQTTVDGLYAAGDIVKGLNQVVIAAAEAALAATDIHNRLRRSGH
ncbi:MAG TPA: NAD(P)/FAD-dependent oxidoreductase [Steroidobacteraceae bacterium]|jgi:thioredoxin reductase (NADPH)|nr:NAD(P)/FAD-dependent oxidoreductase [Steroidobacteraceae bacterium]